MLDFVPQDGGKLSRCLCRADGAGIKHGGVSAVLASLRRAQPKASALLL